MSNEEYVQRAISDYAAKTAVTACSARSHVAEVMVKLENVNGVLAEYFFDAATDKIIRVEIDGEAVEAV